MTEDIYWSIKCDAVINPESTGGERCQFSDFKIIPGIVNPNTTHLEHILVVCSNCGAEQTLESVMSISHPRVSN